MGAGRLAVVWRGPTEVDAVLTVGQLRAAGIAAAVEGSGTPYGATAFPLGGTWQILVRLEDLEAARRVLVEAGEGGNLVVEEADGALPNADQRATLRVAGVAAVGLLVVVVLLSFLEAWG